MGVYEKMAAQVGMTKKQLLAQFKKRKAYCIEDEMRAFRDIQDGVFVSYESWVTEIQDTVDAEGGFFEGEYVSDDHEN